MNLVMAKFHLVAISVGEVLLKGSDRVLIFLIDLCCRKGRFSPRYRCADLSEIKLVSIRSLIVTQAGPVQTVRTLFHFL